MNSTEVLLACYVIIVRLYYSSILATEDRIGVNGKINQANETIDTCYAAALIALVVERGHDVERVLANVDIDFNPVDPATVGYRPDITAAQYTRLYHQVMELLQDERFGISSRRMVTPGAFRMMCYAIIHCESLGSALQRASHFFRIFFGLAVHTSVYVENKQVVVGYSPAPEVASGRADGLAAEQPTTLIEAYALAMWHRFCSWLTGRSLPLQFVHLQGERPAQHKFEELFGCSVHCAQARTAMAFDAALLDRSLVQTEQSLEGFLKTAPFQLMVSTGVTESSLVSQVQGMLGRDFSRGFPGFEQVAAGLNMSAPTLRRRLKREGATYQALKDGCRRDAAVAYLNRPDLSISVVAALMGFTEPSAFHRSFKKWTGVPPGEYRRRLSANL